jgi:hypothetical protein
MTVATYRGTTDVDGRIVLDGPGVIVGFDGQYMTGSPDLAGDYR